MPCATIQARNVKEMRFFEPPEANTRFETGHNGVLFSLPCRNSGLQRLVALEHRAVFCVHLRLFCAGAPWALRSPFDRSRCSSRIAILESEIRHKVREVC